MELYKEIYARPAPMNIVEENGKIWMALMNRNGICEIDKATRQGRICGIFESEPLNKQYLYGYVEKVDKYLIFAPLLAEKIAVYDLETASIFYLPLKVMEYMYTEKEDEAKFWNVFRVCSDVYLLGYSYPAIVKIDIKSMKVTYITDWLDEVHGSIRHGSECGYFGDGQVFSGDLVFIPLVCTNAVLELNTQTLSTKIIKLNIPMEGIGGISSIEGEIIWMVGRGKRTDRIVCWDRKTGDIKNFFVPDLSEDMLKPFYAPICTRHKLFLLPISAQCIYEMDMSAGNIKKSEILLEEFENTGEQLWPDGRTMAVKLQGNILYFLTCADLKWHQLDIQTGKIESYFIDWKEKEEEVRQYFKTVYSKFLLKKALFSEKNFPLKYFVSAIVEMKIKDIGRQNKELLDGRMIYERVCKR